MFFSILTINYNNKKYISQALDSVLVQGFKDFELIIIDDASSDGSKDIISSYLGDKRFSFVSNQENQGYTRNLIKGVELTSGKVIVILDGDDALASNALEKIFKQYKDDQNCDYVYSQCYYCDENLKPVHLGFSKKVLHGKTNLHDNSVVALRTFKKSVYLKTSGYDEKIKFAEDIDLSFKIEEVGKLCFIDKPLYYYRILEKSQTHGFRNTQVNRSSTALAKLNAYKRRLKTSFPNLDKNEIAEVLFWGIATSILARRFKLNIFFVKELFLINPLFFLRPTFYRVIFKKINKMLKLKRENPLLSI